MLQHITVLTLNLAGFAGLAAAIPKYSMPILRKKLSGRQHLILRVLGSMGLAASLGYSISKWHFDVGTVTWLGWLTIAGLLLVFYLLASSQQAKTKSGVARSAQRNIGRACAKNKNIAPGRMRLVRIGFTAAVLLLPIMGFTWGLLNVLNKPLL